MRYGPDKILVVLGLDTCMKIFEDNEDSDVRKRARTSFSNEFKYSGIREVQRNKYDKLETNIFSSDTDCMESKIKEAIHANKKGIGDLYLFETYTCISNCKLKRKLCRIIMIMGIRPQIMKKNHILFYCLALDEVLRQCMIQNKL